MTRGRAFLEQLERYVPADPLEAQHLAAIMHLVRNEPEAFSRNQFSPGHLTASCFIVDQSMGSILLHHHRRLDRWLQMGGHLEGNEEPVAAALREGEEESGLHDLELVREQIFDLDVHPIPAGKGEPAHRHFDIRYLARTATPSAIAIVHEESNDLAWTTLDRAEALMNEEASSRAIRKIVAMLG